MKPIDKDRLQMYASVVKITILLCWLSLFFALTVRFFNDNAFKIEIDNNHFILFFNFIQNTYLKYFVSLLSICTSTYLIMGAVLAKEKLKEWHFTSYLCLCFLVFVVKNFINANFGLFALYVGIIALSAVFNNGWKRLNGVILSFLDFNFIYLSMVAKNLTHTDLQNYATAFIFYVDVYIMYFLYFAYYNLSKLKKGDKVRAIIADFGWLSKGDAHRKGYKSLKRFLNNFCYLISFKWAKKKK